MKVLAHAFHKDNPHVVSLKVDFTESEIMKGVTVHQIEQIIGLQFLEFGKGILHQKMRERIVEWMVGKGLLC